MTAPSAFKFALQCGAAGAWVDVTADVLFEEGTIPFTDGRTSQFDGFSPGTFPFTLTNPAGKYTPDNLLTTLAVPVSEGMGVSMQLDSMLFSGTIRSAALIFPSPGKPDTARVRITCDDMLGNAARREIDNLRDALFAASGGFYLWPFTDASGSPVAVEANGGPSLAIADPAFPPTFGAQSAITAPSVVAMVTSSDLIGNSFPTLPIGSETLGSLGMWVAGGAAGVGLDAHVNYGAWPAATKAPFWGVELASGVAQAFMGATGPTVIVGPTLDSGQHYISVTTATAFVAGAWTFEIELWVDGVSYGSGAYVPGTPVTTLNDIHRALFGVTLSLNGTGTMYASRLAYTASLLDEYGVLATTAEDRLATIAAAVPEVTLDTLPALSPAVLADADIEGQSALDAFNEVIRGEQGYMWSETTGTLLSPVEKIKIAARDRGRAIDYTFDASEILDPIPFIRSLANTVSEFTANGPDASATYQDPDLVPLVGAASSSDSVGFRDYADLHAYASDRVVRGAIHGYPIGSITIDATSPYINRWSALTAIRQGYRLHITGLPEDQLGYDTWDGFVVGRQIDNTQDSQTDEPKSLFTFYLSPWSDVAIFDSARFQAGGTLSLSAGVTTTATTFSVATTDVKLSTAAVPYDLTIGRERLTATNVTAATPQVVTATRSVNGVVEAHNAGENVEIAPEDRFTY